MFRASKRQRLDHPTSWMDCESIEVVVNNPTKISGDSSTGGRILRTQAVPTHLAELFFERFQVEILKRFRYTLSSQIKLNNAEDSIASVKRHRLLLRKRILVGLNECSRSLETRSLKTRPVLIILAGNVNPPSVLGHIPALANEMDPPVPILLLPGNSSSADLGELLGTTNVSAITFVSKCFDEEPIVDEDYHHVNDAVDSFVTYIRRKVGTIIER